MTQFNDGSILSSVDPEIGATLLSRRQAITRGATVSASVAAGLRIASVPIALAALSRDAFAQGIPGAVVEVLNFALTLEYLEAEFYNRGVAASGLIPAADRIIFETIQGHENLHVTFLQNALGSLAVAKPTFDYSAGGGSGTGPYADVFTNYATFKAVAQAFEDTGVRAYKGQAPALQPYDTYLTAALTIHSVEARHASEIRRLRGNFTDTEPFYEGWITGNQTDVPGASAVYAGEDNTNQLGINVAALTSYSTNSATEAFDEPLTKAQVLAIVTPFISTTGVGI
ncbi:MAG: ferritin-like domain-containing protein [Gemmatimonadaceae bacterium]